METSDFLSESLNHSLNWFIQKHWFMQQWNKWLSHWIIYKKNTDEWRNETPLLFLRDQKTI